MSAKRNWIGLAIGCYRGGAVSSVWADPHTKTTEAIVVAAFVESHAGWSADELLLDGSRRTGFLAACLKQSKLLSTSLGVQQTGGQTELTEDKFCEALRHLRKAGSRLPATEVSRTHARTQLRQRLRLGNFRTRSIAIRT